jgi:hypothetical protein
MTTSDPSAWSTSIFYLPSVHRSGVCRPTVGFSAHALDLGSDFALPMSFGNCGRSGLINGNYKHTPDCAKMLLRLMRSNILDDYVQNYMGFSNSTPPKPVDW